MGLSVPEQHQKQVALGTFRMSEMGAKIAGGPNHRESVKILRGLGMSDAIIRKELLKWGHDHEAIERYLEQ